MTDTESELRQKHYREYLENYRCVRIACHKCGGSGVVLYGSTATWSGGIGGAAMTNDVCDHCWGSGDEHRHWTDLRQLEENQRAAITKEAGLYLCRWLGLNKGETDESLQELAVELEKMSRGRKQRSRWYYHTCDRLSQILKRLAAGEHIDMSEAE
jgi:hypothetical protein